MKKEFFNKYYILFSFLLFLFIWQMASIIINSFAFPSPIIVVKVLFDLVVSLEIFPHIFASLKRTLLGFIAGIVLGSILGYILATNDFIFKLINPMVELLRPIPPIAWIPLAILWFGIGDSSAVFLIFIAAFFPIFTNTFFGVKSLPKIYYRLSKDLKLSKWQEFYKIKLQFVLPYFLTGCELSMGSSWVTVIVSEMIAANEGLGYFIEVNRVLLKPEFVIAAMLIIGLIGFLLHSIIVLIEKKLTHWRDVKNA